MSGISSLLNIAKSTLAAQQYGMTITGNNIANVNTDGYSRQIAVYSAKSSVSEGGLLLGQGAELSSVERCTDELLESQLREQQSNLSSSTEMESYMTVLEAMFDETSETGLSALLSEFWTLWQDVSDNPSGASERTVLCEYSDLTAEQFNTLSESLDALSADLTDAMETGIERINEITAEIADLNTLIVAAGSDGSANELLDTRNTLLNELAEYIDVNSFEQDNGSLTILSVSGVVLVQGNNSYTLELGGSDGTSILWKGSGTSEVDITDSITTGKLGGWLEMRDEVISELQLNLDALAKEFIWTVNSQHSQGVGLEGFSSVTGTYDVADTTEALTSADSGLDYYDKISAGSFNLWVYDSNGDLVGSGPTSITIDSSTTLETLQAAIDGVSNVSASITSDNTLSITADSGYTFAFSDDSSNVLAALGINTFFSGSSADSLALNSQITSNENLVAAAQIDSSGDYASGDNSNALAMVDLQYETVSISQWTADRTSGSSEGSVSTTIEGYYGSLVSALGVSSASVSSSLDVYEATVQSLTTLRDSISAVSVDEEMVNLIQYQHVYTAAAKLITASDEMLETLMNLT